MDDTPAGSVHRKRDIFRRLKNTLRGSSRDRDIFQEPSTLEITTNPAAKSGSLNPKIDTSKTENNDTKDYWQIAYNELTESDRKTLATPFGTAATDHREAGCGQTKEILEQVVKATEAQYRENQNKNGIRATAHRILDSALSFQDVVSNVVRFDPTGYASSAWAIVSLGLTMAKNHADLQDALFETSGYLADLLTRCAFIEEQFYCGPGPVLLNAEKERSIVQVYVAILQYSAEVRRVQQFGTANDIVASITGVASKQLADLKTLIKKEESHLHHWLLLDQHLHRKVEAEAILTHIDELKVDIEKVRDAVNILNLPFADGAIFDSFIDQHEDECLSGTRAELLQQVQQWGKSSNKCIFWLSGMAGTGKTTIARTVARYFKEDGILGASFFFKRGQGDQGSAVKFFPTIVKQLAIHTPQMITGIQKALQNDPAISGKSLREQFDKLMLQPLLAMDQSQSSASTVIVIDALDECERDEDMEVILELLPKVEKATCLRIQFFLTSRPESAIRFGFDQIDQSDYQNTILQNLDNDVIKHDITLYLREEFRRIRQKRPRDLPSSWPGEERIEALATMAVPLFIFAATVCRFVADKRWNPERRLQQFFDDSPGSKMDKTYRPILNQLLAEDESDMDQLVEEFQKTIGVIILLATPLSLSALTQLVEMPEVEISTRLDAFHSVLTIPDKPNLPIQTLHLSFHDYLVDEHMKAQESTTRFWVDKIKNHEFIARQCLIVMGRHLKKNICRLPSYGTSRTEIDPDSIAQFLLPALQYTCRYWVYHLAQSSLSAKTIDQILPFLEEHFLHWLEVMAILGIISECLNAVDTLLVLTKDPSSTSLSLFLSDARRYIHKFMNIVDMAPLQLYSSGLIFAPQEALIKTNFLRELPNWLYRAPRVEENWSPELQTLEGHSDSVQSVAFSPDGQLLASGSQDKTIKLWDPATGTLKHTLEGHSRWVQSVAFSPDGQLLASGSGDGTIKLWDPATGTLKHTLDQSVTFSPDGQLLASGSDNETIQLWDVQSVTFSPDGQLLASGSLDKTIKLWDPATGALKHTLKGHSSSVQSVTFSPDSQLLASGSHDETIKLWDPATGALKHTLEGHSGSVQSVAFSPDGQLLASGSGDGIIKFWDPATGALKHTLEGHSSSVQSVTFSPDGQLLASGLNDETIKLWDPATGALKHTLEGHSSLVQSVTFSPDGQLLASGLDDRTIKLWDPVTSALEHTLEGHSRLVHLVTFSPDGQLLVSGSNDGTIKLWDPATGALKHTLEGHSCWLQSVAFSPDGQLLASGSDDGTIKLSDSATGALKHTLEGHSHLVQLITFSPDGQLLASGSFDKTIKLWDPATGALKHTLEGHSSWVQLVTFSPDSQLLASGSYGDGIIKLWDPATGTLKHTLEGHSSLDQVVIFSVQSVAFSPDSQLLASGSHDDGTIKLWDPATGALKHTLEGHSSSVQSVAFSPDGQLLASGSYETIKLWDPATGALKHTISTDSVITNIEFSKQLPQLITNMGYFDIQDCYESLPSSPSEKVAEVSLAGRWVTIQGQRELWLPPDYQPCSSIVKSGTIAVGCANGRVVIIMFSIT